MCDRSIIRDVVGKKTELINGLRGITKRKERSREEKGNAVELGGVNEAEENYIVKMIAFNGKGI